MKYLYNIAYCLDRNLKILRIKTFSIPPVPKYNQKIIETNTKTIHLTRDKDTPMKSVGVKLLFRAQTNGHTGMMWSC